MFLEIPATMFSYMLWNTVFWWVSFGGRIPWKVTVSYKISNMFEANIGWKQQTTMPWEAARSGGHFFPVLEESPRNLIWKEVVLTKCLWIAHSTNREAEIVQVNFELLVSVQFCISVEFSRKGSEKSAGNSQPHPVAHTFGEVKDCKSIKEEDECMKSGFSKDSKDGWKRWLLDGMFLSRHTGNNLMAWDGDIRISQSLSMLENLAVLPL